MIRIFQRAKLPFQKDVFPFFEGIVEIKGYVSHIRLYHLFISEEFFI